MQMRIFFPGNQRADADYLGYTIQTDQPVQGGGEGAFPAPFDLFLASMGTCVGIYVLRFCQMRQLDTEGLEVIQTWDYDVKARLITRINFEIKLPTGFPEKYYDAIINTANLCAVKKHLDNPPSFNTTVSPAS
jgi:putative redox protein